jgi:RNA polymerase sigma-70 factor (ECF subfamily)
VDNNNIQAEFLELYQPIHSQLTRYCRAISGNTEDAKDLMNDTLLNAFENFNMIRNKSAFKSYLFSIASNLNKKRIRRLKFVSRMNPNEVNCLCELTGNPEYITDFQIIYKEILLLPAKTAETLFLFYISDMSLQEIRKIQGGSLSGVKLRIKRGREKLLFVIKTPENLKTALLFLTL